MKNQIKLVINEGIVEACYADEGSFDLEVIFLDSAYCGQDDREKVYQQLEKNFEQVGNHVWTNYVETKGDKE